VFVPPNDARTTKDPAKSIRVIRAAQEPAAANISCGDTGAEPPLVTKQLPDADGLEAAPRGAVAG